ncbi:MAG: Mov34/MPN/PAD-1 family protein [Gemmatales bacterium]|nr:Mov34/MPN/PAD-1 family protein [Gemmatales bacterium]MDW8174221.1 Mov34/MPN/PAD-1 family protein [Gemmatales bacterium]
MWSELVSLTQRVWQRASNWLDQLVSPASRPTQSTAASGPARPASLRRLQRVCFSSAVLESVFDSFAEHRQSDRGEEETGWVLLGYRQEAEAIVLAALPAGTFREAGVAHVRFNTLAQAVATRILRARDRQLTILGVLHTHPGRLRHPSRGDFEGDSQWVRLLPGQEGVFGIGTVEEDDEAADAPIVIQPSENSWYWRGLRLSWYALAAGDRQYRALPVQVILGEDLAAFLLPVWETLEYHAVGLEQLFRHMTLLRVETLTEQGEDGRTWDYLSIRLPVHEREEIRVLLDGPKLWFFYDDGENTYEVDGEPPVDRGVFLVLAELARRREMSVQESTTLTEQR